MLFRSDTTATHVQTLIQTTRCLLWGEDLKRCRNYDTLTVVAIPNPSVRLAATADTICQGHSATLTAAGGVRYAWGMGPALYDTLHTQVVAPRHDTVVYVWGDDSNGLCAALDSLRIAVLPLPVVRIEADNSALCWGDTAQLTAVCTEGAYSWNGGAYGNDTLRVSPHDSAWYHVAAQAANGCYAYDSLLVEVHPYYHVRLDGDTHLCQGDTLLVTATGSALYAWGGGSQFTTLDTQYIAPLHDTLIVVQGTARDSLCRARDTLAIRVHQRPNLYVDPETAAVCLGDSVVISASGCEQYRWMGEDHFGMHNGYHVFYPQSSITYIVAGSMAGGVCEVAAPVTITVIDTPHVQIAGAADICLGDSVRLTASGGAEYAWGGTAIFGSSGYFSDMPATLGTRHYRVAAREHGLQCTGRAAVSVGVHPVPVLTLSADDTVLCNGETAVLSASGACQYSWDMGAGYAPVGQMQVSPSHTTTYTVYGADSMMLCADTQQLAITVHPLPAVACSADTTEICLRGSVTLHATGASRYAWDDNGPYATLDSLTLTPLQSAVVRLRGVDANGCENRDSVVLTLHAPFQPYTHDHHHVAVHLYPTVSAAIDHPEVCLGSGVTLTAAGAEQYRWLDMGDDNRNPIALVPQSSTTYMVEGRMEYGCPDTAVVSVAVIPYPPVGVSANATEMCVGDTLRLTASGAPHYAFQDGGFADDSAYWVVPPEGRQCYRLRGATDNLLCAAADSVWVTVYPYPAMLLHGATRWCEGSEVVLTVENPADTLCWTAIPDDPSLLGQQHSDTLRLHPSLSTVYRLYGRSHVCSVSMEKEVEIVAYPHLTLHATADRVCIGDTIMLTAAGGDLYAWNGSLGADNRYTTADTMYYAPTATGFYPVVATTYDTLCSLADSLFVYVDTMPALAITGSDSGCLGRTVTLTAQSEVPILWTSTPYDPGLDTQSSMFTIVVSPQEATEYTIHGSNGRCHASAHHTVLTGPMPRADGVSLPMRVRRAEADVCLVNRSVGAEGFYWLFPDGSQRYGDHYTYQVSPLYMADTFPVRIVAYRGGCADTALIPILLFNDEQWVANVFTPAAETNNRFFVPVLNKDDFHVAIFNRRGIKVYESDDPDEGWDGRSCGVLCPQGAYVYRIRTSPKYSAEVKYVYGTVTLIR